MRVIKARSRETQQRKAILFFLFHWWILSWERKTYHRNGYYCFVTWFVSSQVMVINQATFLTSWWVNLNNICCSFKRYGKRSAKKLFSQGCLQSSSLNQVIPCGNSPSCQEPGRALSPRRNLEGVSSLLDCAGLMTSGSKPFSNWISHI